MNNSNVCLLEAYASGFPVTENSRWCSFALYITVTTGVLQVKIYVVGGSIDSLGFCNMYLQCTYERACKKKGICYRD